MRIYLQISEVDRYRHSNSIIATASTKEKLDFLYELGVTRAVNYKTEDFEAAAKEVTKGKGVDVLIDFVGKTHWHKNIESLAFDGRMTLLALLSGQLTFLNGCHLILTALFTPECCGSLCILLPQRMISTK